MLVRWSTPMDNATINVRGYVAPIGPDRRVGSMAAGDDHAGPFARRFVARPGRAPRRLAAGR